MMTAIVNAPIPNRRDQDPVDLRFPLLDAVELGESNPRPALRVVPGQRQSLLVRERFRVTVRDLE